MSEVRSGSYVLRRLWCWLFGHAYEVLQHFGKGARRVTCDRCGGDWAMHDETRSFVPWDGQFEGMYQLFGYTIRRRP